YSHRRLYDLQGAVEKLPRLLPDNTPTEALQATGTESAGLSPVCTGFVQTVDSGCVSLTPDDRSGPQGSADGKTPLPLKISGVESKRDGVRPSERQEAPPGFEPGMADLQSAALPLG